MVTLWHESKIKNLKFIMSVYDLEGERSQNTGINSELVF